MDKIIIYCDGGCRGNGKNNNVGGWGVYLTYQDKTKELYGGTRGTTNNIMELTACIEGLRAVKWKDVPIEVMVDSAYVLNGITSWIYNWMKKGWVTSKKEPVENKELWQQLYAEKQKFKDIKFVKVKGHSDNFGNNKADALANRAMDEQ
ncbi:ribonuclease HI [Niameybacter massiliensis]|uniref:ribonuclease HI n=1 Tax=Niameybacter massiliensis TaxID=1658108 RepID=UPI0006B4F94A|nr:ribonuclease HI [Niameybacter massiliensis]